MSLFRYVILSFCLSLDTNPYEDLKQKMAWWAQVDVQKHGN